MELHDLYDEQGRLLGKTCEHGITPQPGEFLQVVGVWVVNSSQEILLTRRSPEKRFAPNLWENTGGHVKAGESLKEAAARELFEETGLTARPEELMLVGETVSPPYLCHDYMLYRDAELAEIRLQPGETCDVAWVSGTRFDQMIATGELAPSTAAHLAPYRQNFDRLLHEAGPARRAGCVR